MAASYRIYWDAGTGVMDWSTPIYDGPSLAYVTGPLAYPATYRFAVRAYDPASGLEDQSVEYRALVLDATGADITGRPAAVAELVAVATPAGALARWSYPAAVAPAPTDFDLWLGVDAPPDYATAPTRSVKYAGDQVVGLAATLPGLTAGHTYTVGVKARNATGRGPAAEAAVTGALTGPAAVVDLAAAAAWGD